MAITVTNNPSSLRIKFYLGKDDEQKNIIKSKTFSNLRPNSTNQDVYDVGAALVSLQKHNAIDIIKLDNTILSK
ncbi:MAG: DUF1659 domain-containing protein [Romboutsia sp.]